MRLKQALDEIKREMSGYLLAYDPRGRTPFACRSWWCETGLWLHGYGDSEEEAAQDCLTQVLKFKGGFN